MTETAPIQNAARDAGQTEKPWGMRGKVNFSRKCNGIDGWCCMCEGHPGQCLSERDRAANRDAEAADARLRAAAPDLLKEARDLWHAATQALAQLERHDAATADAIRVDFRDALERPAITKATTDQ